MQVCWPAGLAMETCLAGLVMTGLLQMHHKAHLQYIAKSCIWVLTWWWSGSGHHSLPDTSCPQWPPAAPQKAGCLCSRSRSQRRCHLCSRSQEPASAWWSQYCCCGPLHGFRGSWAAWAEQAGRRCTSRLTTDHTYCSGHTGAPQTALSRL